MEAKWSKRDRKLKTRRDLKSVKKAMYYYEPRNKKRRKSSEDEKWEINKLRDSIKD